MLHSEDYYVNMKYSYFIKVFRESEIMENAENKENEAPVKKRNRSNGLLPQSSSLPPQRCASGFFR